ncbi:mitotic spindle-associated MMXD complex subunit MIP18 isoform X3 [Theropithecus gelada]|uniref:mitotic spindle-associated MMXD complex subunit MIP18 isoform X3 n=1 Tax=Theropithecus gelada TaxID=9565 RepID=UPI000DC1B2E4|nr:mitotic spindle-associated MMXD complex subunit MIP18 isoform X3 [Theropithecus gelada]
MVGGGGVGSGGLLENANPLIYQRSGERPVTAGEEDEQIPDSIDAREIFDLIRSINDPEHPLTLEELNVVEQVRVQVTTPRVQWLWPSHQPFRTAAWPPLLACPSRSSFCALFLSVSRWTCTLLRGPMPQSMQ